MGLMVNMGVRMMDWGVKDHLFAALLGLNIILGIVFGWLLVRVKQQPEKANLLVRFLTANGLSILFALATLLSIPPFQINHSLGIGLLGSFIGSSLAFWVGVMGTKVWLGYLGALLPFAIPLTLHQGNPFPSLWGMMIGTMLVWFCVGNAWNLYGLTVISLIAAIGLARFHEPPTEISKHLWQALPLTLTTAGWIGVSVLGAWRRYWQNNVSELTFVFISSIALIVGAFLMGYWGGDRRFLAMTVLTCFVAFVVVRFQLSRFHDLTILFWIGLLVISFAVIPVKGDLNLLGGYGAALASITLTWLATGQIEGQMTLRQGAIILVTFALFRLFVEVYPLRTPRADLYTHYTFVGFLLGSFFPVMLMSWMKRNEHLIRDLTTGFWAAVMPLILGAVWGVKAVVGYLAGGIPAVLLIPNFNSQTLLAGFATALPLTALVEPASDLPREIRTWILAGAATTFALALLVDTFVQWLKERRDL